MSVVLLTTAVLAGGCAATNSGPSRVAGPISTYPGDSGYPGNSGPRSPASRSATVEMEADGLPAQVAPRNRRPMRDDPTEPWSPNYGTAPSGKRADLAIRREVTAAVPVAPTTTPSAALRLHPDDVIRLAIAEHEMRRR